MSVRNPMFPATLIAWSILPLASGLCLLGSLFLGEQGITLFCQLLAEQISSVAQAYLADIFLKWH